MLIVFLLFVILLLCLLIVILFRKSLALERSLEELSFEKSSQAVRYGKTTEQFVPFIEELPFSPENFRFIGSPIDGVSFEPDRIVFCEFKAGRGSLNSLQQHIKRLVEGKKVEWLEFRLR
jgi:predicted Holliday junction resolvase-like endonuclease